MKKESIKFSAMMLTSTFISHITVSLAMSSIGPLAPFLQQDLGISRTQIGALTSVHSIGWIVMAFMSGSVIERTGIRIWMLICPVLSGVCILLFSGIRSYTQGIVLFGALGFVFSFVNPATTKAILLSFSQVGRGTALALKQTGTPAGVFLASVVLPIIAVSAGWRWGMIFAATVCISLGVAGWALYREKQNIPEVDGTARQWWDFRKDFGVLLHNRDFLLISFLQGVFNIGMFVIQTYTVLYLVESLGFSTIFAGFVSAMTQFSGILGRLFWGVMSDFLFAGKRVPVLQIAGLTTAGSLFGFALINGTTPSWIIWVISSIAGMGCLGFSGTSILLRAELAGKNLAATSTGLGMSISAWGVLVGPLVFGFIVDVTLSYRVAWICIAAISFAATLFLGVIRERVHDGKPEES